MTKPAAKPTERLGPLAGLRVIELASEFAASAGKMLGDLGAEVVLVEPPGGHHTRTFEPFLDDEPGLERSLWWWHYNTSKLGVTLDLDDPADVDRLRSLISTADLVLEAETPGRMHSLGIDYEDMQAACPALIWTSVTQFGRARERSKENTTDLTILAEGGPVWSCGYDDHSIPPIRGGGNQGYHTAALWAVEGILAAVLWRYQSGRGQHVDVSMHAAANVTTEAATYEYLVAGKTVQRMTGRHAAVYPSMPTHALGTDGRYVNTGVPARSAKEFQGLLDILDELGLRDGFEEAFFLEEGVKRGSISFADIFEDPEVMAMFGAGRNAICLIAEKLPSVEFFTRMQDVGISCGVIYSPEEALFDPHFVDRGFPVEVYHDDLDRNVVYAGAPFKSSVSPWQISSRAPRLGEHNDQVLSGDR